MYCTAKCNMHIYMRLAKIRIHGHADIVLLDWERPASHIKPLWTARRQNLVKPSELAAKTFSFSAKAKGFKGCAEAISVCRGGLRLDCKDNLLSDGGWETRCASEERVGPTLKPPAEQEPGPWGCDRNLLILLLLQVS